MTVLDISRYHFYMSLLIVNGSLISDPFCVAFVKNFLFFTTYISVFDKTE